MPGGGLNFHRNYRQDIHRLPHRLWRPGDPVFPEAILETIRSRVHLR
jgi:hypothetical protein